MTINALFVERETIAFCVLQVFQHSGHEQEVTWIVRRHILGHVSVEAHHPHVLKLHTEWSLHIPRKRYCSSTPTSWVSHPLFSSPLTKPPNLHAGRVFLMLCNKTTTRQQDLAAPNFASLLCNSPIYIHCIRLHNPGRWRDQTERVPCACIHQKK
jgi:hypothetical protein